MTDGSEFQTAGAAKLKPREAKLVGTRGTDNRLVFAEHSARAGVSVIIQKEMEVSELSGAERIVGQCGTFEFYALLHRQPMKCVLWESMTSSDSVCFWNSLSLPIEAASNANLGILWVIKNQSLISFSFLALCWRCLLSVTVLYIFLPISKRFTYLQNKPLCIDCCITGDGLVGGTPAEHRVGEAEAEVTGPAAVSGERMVTWRAGGHAAAAAAERAEMCHTRRRTHPPTVHEWHEEIRLGVLTPGSRRYFVVIVRVADVTFSSE